MKPAKSASARWPSSLSEPARRARWATAVGLILILTAAGGSGCRSAARRSSLAPGHADFLSRVRYIITRSEERIFLTIPAGERETFIDEFWKRRDPDPYSVENEFKDEYFNRLETADRLFSREGKPGWLTDRGRVHVLFGPPFDRIINPIDSGYGGRCSEVWYYGGFPVLFRDPDCSGHLVLETYDLSAIREYNLSYMHQFNEAQARAQLTYSRKRVPFKFGARVRLGPGRPGRVEGVISLSIPYAAIWFESPAIGSLVTTLELEADLKDASGLGHWTHREAIEVTAREEILERAPDDESFVRDVPFGLETTPASLRGKKFKFEVRLRNRTGGEEARKTIGFPGAGF